MSTKNIVKAGEEQLEELDEAYEMAEKEYKTPKTEIDILGRPFQIVSIAPEWVQLFVARYGRGKDKEVPADKYMDFILKVLGDEMLDYLLETMDNDTEHGTLEKVMEKIFKVWTPETETKKK